MNLQTLNNDDKSKNTCISITAFLKNDTRPVGPMGNWGENLNVSPVPRRRCYCRWPIRFINLKRALWLVNSERGPSPWVALWQLKGNSPSQPWNEEEMKKVESEASEASESVSGGTGSVWRATIKKQLQCLQMSSNARRVAVSWCSINHGQISTT